MAMQLAAVLKPLAARFACCSKPFIASTTAFERLSVIAWTTALSHALIVVANFWNGAAPGL